MTQPPATHKQALSWIVLIFGALFLLYLTPSIFITVLLPIWKPEEFSVVSAVLSVISLSFVAATIWTMRRAYKSLRAVKAERSFPVETIIASKKETALFPLQKETTKETKKLIWPWLVIAPGALLLIGSGPGAIMLPIAPLFLAAMSTDSGNTPDYVPFSIIAIGYGLMFTYAIFVFFAIKALRSR